MSLAMTLREREAYLADVHVGVIAIERPGQAPIAVPIWYDYDPAIGIWVITGEDSQKGRALHAAGRFTLCAQSETAPDRYVSAEGPIRSVRPARREEDSRPMARRYLGGELGDRFVDGNYGSGDRVFTMRPERWRTVDYGKLGALG